MTTVTDKGLAVGGLDVIAEPECWRLLASQPVGRFAVIVGHYPVVVPVNHVVAAQGIVFKSAPGAKLGAIHRSNVSFEVDQFDPDHKTGWSVLVRGSAREIKAAHATSELIEAVQAVLPVPWAPGPRDHIVRIVPDSITGRRIRLDEPPSEADIKGFL